MDNSGLWYLENIDLNTILCPKKLGNTMELKGHSDYKKGDYIYMTAQNSDSENRNL